MFKLLAHLLAYSLVTTLARDPYSVMFTSSNSLSLRKIVKATNNIVK